jgi:hypothetical protein
VAEQGLLDKAMALIPRGTKPNAAKRRPDARKQLALLQKKLATLVEDVEKLAKLIAPSRARPPPRGQTKPRGKPAPARSRTKKTPSKKARGSAAGSGA